MAQYYPRVQSMCGRPIPSLISHRHSPVSFQFAFSRVFSVDTREAVQQIKMASLLGNNLCFVSSSLFHCHNVTVLSPRIRFSTQTHQKEDVPFIAQYLVSTFGISKDRAIRITSGGHLRAIKTADRPESVIRFLKDAGLTDIEVKAAISSQPCILGRNVSKTLEPAANEVIAAGFTREILTQLIRYNPMTLTLKNTVSHLKFWRTFVGCEKTLLKFIKNPIIFNIDINKRVIPRVNLLREYGLSDQQIAVMLLKTSVVGTPDSMKLLFERIEKLGFPRGSKMFLVAVEALGGLRKDTFDRKVMFFKTAYGWSDEDINSALKRYPKILTVSREKVESIMDFFIRKVGLNARSIALRPTLLGYSLERRLIPRHHVLTVLKSKGLKNNCSLQTAAKLSEKNFIEKYILPYKEELSDLEESYVAARDGKMSLS